MKGFSSEIFEEICVLMRKYHRGLNTNLFEIQVMGNYLILKGYLQGKSVRIIIARRAEDMYIPLALYKKESNHGYNIRENFDTR